MFSGRSADLAVLLTLESQARVFKDAIDAVLPAVGRLALTDDHAACLQDHLWDSLTEDGMMPGGIAAILDAFKSFPVAATQA